MNPSNSSPVNESEWEETAQHLRQLLPPTPTESKPRESSIWTDAEVGAARTAGIQRHLKAGWKLIEGLLVKANVKKKPTALLIPPARPHFNPKKDAFAIKLGGVFVGPNRYRLSNGLMVDEWGACRDPRECPECGSIDKEYAFQRKTVNRNPFAKPWEQAWTYCHTCITPDELERIKREDAPKIEELKRRRR